MWQTRQVDFFHHSPVATEGRLLLTYLEYMEVAGEHLEKVYPCQIILWPVLHYFDVMQILVYPC